MIKYSLVSINAESPNTRINVWITRPEQRPIEIKKPDFLFSRLWFKTNNMSGPGIKVKANDDIRNNNIWSILWI